MAQKVKIILEDDLTGSPAEETVRFGLDGKRYEMDLSAENAAKLREVLRPFADKARRLPTERRSTPKQRVTSQHDWETPKIRAWAQENGYKVSSRGRIHQHIKEAYYAAQERAPGSH